MKMLKINMVLPFPATKPVGGVKIMYEYANRLSEQGHDVVVYHSIKRPFKKSATPLWYKVFAFKLRNVARPKWFRLHNDVQSLIVPAVTDKYIRNADITMSTWWQMAYAVHGLSAAKGKKFNLIQDYETWGGQQEKVDASYSLGNTNLVIAKYLQNIVAEKSGIIPAHIPNAVDAAKFFIEQNPRQRDPHSVIMLYSEEPRKGTAFGIAALEKTREEFPDLKAWLFGVYPKPAQLPSWINYTQRPENLRSLYNKAAVFFSPSLGEGWALPPAEAMACGCAVVCTDIGGHQDYATDQQTALLVTPENVADMVEKLKLVLENKILRQELSANGFELMRTEFSWKKSLEKLQTCFYASLKT